MSFKQMKVSIFVLPIRISSNRDELRSMMWQCAMIRPTPGTSLKFHSLGGLFADQVAMIEYPLSPGDNELRMGDRVKSDLEKLGAQDTFFDGTPICSQSPNLELETLPLVWLVCVDNLSAQSTEIENYDWMFGITILEILSNQIENGIPDKDGLYQALGTALDVLPTPNPTLMRALTHALK